MVTAPKLKPSASTAAPNTVAKTATTEGEAPANEGEGDTEGDEDDPVDAPAVVVETEEEPDAAKAIAASAEARSHPEQALKAISANLTLGQFKAMVDGIPAATAATGRSSALRDAMAGVSRVGVDAAGASVPKTFGDALLAAAKSQASKKA